MEIEEKSLLCVSCMHPVPADSGSCPFCGYDGHQENPAGLLPIGTRLRKGGYISGRVLKIGKSSVDYAGYDVDHLRICTVREYYPAGICRRDREGLRVVCAPADTELFREGFESFERSVERFGREEEDSALPLAYGSFAENGTAYLVYENFEGIALKELLRKNGRPLTWQQSVTVLRPVLKALRSLHASGTVHGDINPDSILINLNGDVRLRSVAAEGEIPPDDEYAAPETFTGAPLTPAADVYSLGAVLYRCMTGIVPDTAAARKKGETMREASSLDPAIPSQVSRAMKMALELDSARRMQTVEEFEVLMGEEFVSAEPLPEPKKRTPRYGLRRIAAAVLIALALAGIVYLTVRLIIG